MLTSLTSVKSIVFDLDGTLYTSDGIAREIHQAAVQVVAESRGISPKEGQSLLDCSRRRLGETLEEEPTLTRICMELGIEVRDLHRAFRRNVHPERYLEADPVLYALLDSLRDDFDLYIYTNNSLPLSQKILALLGVEGLFRRLFTIEFTWVPKPDLESLHKLLEEIGGQPDSFLFIGDRHQVDLKAPARLGIPTLQVNETADLLQIHKLLGIIP
ncbi:haloacid dehalogenase [Desulfuromonas versatilis]|uniref:phosphoglycolate phosphatase n=1 Tax=Desulfuromonas versatilis TaxID=2802975 RepID=A0ABM8HUL9_9BACT|nr:HAD family hydrolase [Desulfuromonas versatilis]BCR04197.1 haloacid dehalogenase [Desulfuromonas versatilis]